MADDGGYVTGGESGVIGSVGCKTLRAVIRAAVAYGEIPAGLRLEGGRHTFATSLSSSTDGRVNPHSHKRTCSTHGTRLRSRRSVAWGCQTTAVTVVGQMTVVKRNGGQPDAMTGRRDDTDEGRIGGQEPSGGGTRACSL
jgi:hypothetical protein